jgi:Fic family protein
LHLVTNKFRQVSSDTSDAISRKELERFVIELSWKSSKIEGNTYSLLDTERLIKDSIEAEGHPKEEAIMILNHKSAFDYILSAIDNYKITKLNAIIEIHQLLTKNLGIDSGIRNKMVGITGSKYKPLEFATQIRVATENLLYTINKLKDPYSKALLTLVGIAYIQPFEDGNKRTSRLSANAVLLANNCAPLSYRSIDEISYKESMLVFYEKNSISAMKEIFIEQYNFACENYLIAMKNS